jgi:NAD(P)-dependent dehydrogenase (short-subunit alcohol dehydrogenase family)
MDRPFETDFSTFFPERKPLYPDNFGNFAALGRCVLITGAGGSIGSALAQRICGASRLQLILMGHSEQAISLLRREVSSCDRENQVKFALATYAGRPVDRKFCSVAGGSARNHSGVSAGSNSDEKARSRCGRIRR